MTGDDEQRVVDADAEADHRGDHRRGDRRVDEVRHDPDAAETDGEPDQCGHDRHSHGDQRTEGDEQHDHRDGEADGLVAFDLLGDQRAGQLGLDTLLAGDLSSFRGVVGVLGLERIDGVVDGRERRLAVRTHGGSARLERIRYLGHVGPLGEIRQGGVDGSSVLRIGDRAVLGVEHDLTGGTGQCGEPVAQQVIGTLGFGARRREVVLRLTTQLGVETENGDGDDQPDAEHPERVAGTALAEAVQER